MADLVALAQVKQKLDIPLSDTTRDGEITLVMQDVVAWILKTTHLDLDGGNSYSELHRNVQSGGQLYLNWRPVATVSSVTARRPGGNAQELEYDLIDAEQGLLILLGGTGFRSWPPVQTERPVWFGWREARWPLVTVNYATAAATIAPDLSDVAAAITAAYWMAHKAGLRVYSAFGSIIERYSTDQIPTFCLPVLASYQRQKVYGTP